MWFFITLVIALVITFIVILKLFTGNGVNISGLSSIIPNTSLSKLLFIGGGILLLYFFGGAIKPWVAELIAHSDPGMMLNLTTEGVARWLWVIIPIMIGCYLIYATNNEFLAQVFSAGVTLLVAGMIIYSYLQTSIGNEVKRNVSQSTNCTLMTDLDSNGGDLQSNMIHLTPMCIGIETGNRKSLRLTVSSTKHAILIKFSDITIARQPEFFNSVTSYDIIKLQPHHQPRDGRSGKTYLINNKLLRNSGITYFEISVKAVEVNRRNLPA